MRCLRGRRAADVVDAPTGIEDAFLEGHTFDFVKASYLRSIDTLPLWKECAQAGALTKIHVTLGDAITGKFVGSKLAVSHRWVSPASPDPSSSQMRSIKTFLAAHPSIEDVWIDWSCVPQGARSDSEQRFFDGCLRAVNLLYLAMRVLVIADSAYMSRFWTQFECLLGLRRVEVAGLTPISEAESRAAFRVVGIESGTPGTLIGMLKRRWTACTIDDALALLAEEDVQVTNGRDKTIQLEKLAQLQASTARLFPLALARLSPQDRALWEGRGLRHAVGGSRELGDEVPASYGDGAAARDETPVQELKLDLSSWVKGPQVAAGTFEEIFQALHKESGHLFVVKKVELDDDSDQDGRRQQLRELTAEVGLYQEMKHPNIVAYLGSEVTETFAYLYFEHMAAGSLENVTQNFGPLQESLLRLYLRDVVSALAYLHAWDPPVVIRDLRSRNIFTTHNGRAKIVDFACAVRAKEEASSGHAVKGSVQYMAREVFEGHISPAVDIWACGCLAIELATAGPPWKEGHSPMALYTLMKKGQRPDIPEGLSPACRDFIDQCLRHERSERPRASELLRHDFLRGRGTTPTAP